MKFLASKKKVITVTLIATALLSTPVMANNKSGKIDRIQNHQKHKIFQGIKSGEVTRKEGWRLGKQQRRIYREERRFKADGDFTRRERAKVHRDLARASRSIYRAKHN